MSFGIRVALLEGMESADPGTVDPVVSQKLLLIRRIEYSGNISAECARAGISRSAFYLMRKTLRLHGPHALVPKKRRLPRMPNALPDEVVAEVMRLTLAFPTYSYVRIADRLRRQGHRISAGGVRKVWERRGLSTRLARLCLLEREAQAGRATLSPRALRVLAELRAPRPKPV